MNTNLKPGNEITSSETNLKNDLWLLLDKIVYKIFTVQLIPLCSLMISIGHVEWWFQRLQENIFCSPPIK